MSHSNFMFGTQAGRNVTKMSTEGVKPRQGSAATRMQTWREQVSHDKTSLRFLPTYRVSTPLYPAQSLLFEWQLQKTAGWDLRYGCRLCWANLGRTAELTGLLGRVRKHEELLTLSHKPQDLHADWQPSELLTVFLSDPRCYTGFWVLDLFHF